MRSYCRHSEDIFLLYINTNSLKVAGIIVVKEGGTSKGESPSCIKHEKNYAYFTEINGGHRCNNCGTTCYCFYSKHCLQQNRARKIEPYGQLVSVNGKKMNITIQGKGTETIVLLPGFGTAAPTLDFKPLIDELAPYYKIVSVEPFGYGLSEDTAKERSTENIVSEIHEALQELKIDRYMLMGHSIAGIYGLDYVNKYRNEVTGFVGIDSSVPTQDGMDTKFPIKSLQLLKKSGIARILIKFTDDPYAGLPYDDDTKEQIRMITLKNFYNTSTSNELESIYKKFTAAKNLTFPKDLPLLLFVQANSEGVEKIGYHSMKNKSNIQFMAK